MRKWLWVCGLIVACGLLLGATPVWARTHIDWFFGFNVGPPVVPYGYPVAVPYGYPVVAPPVIIQPPPVYVPPAPVYVAPPAVAPTWWYCPNPPGYYPYIAQCPGGWQPVPATPP
jgi:hypothetical protein